MNASIELRRLLDRVGVRFRSERLWGGLAVCWLVLALVGLVVGGGTVNRPLALGLAGSAVVLGGLWWLVVGRTGRDPHWIARRIEAHNPDLSALLLTAVDQQPKNGRMGYLQTSVVEKALAHSRAHDWSAVVPAGRLTVTRVVHGATFLGLVAVIAFLTGRSHSSAGTAPAADAGVTPGLTIEPGNAEVERGTPLLVTARFAGPVPTEATLAVDAVPPVFPRPMTRSLEDPTFAGYVASVESDLAYRVEFPGGRSETYRVKVFEHPELKRVNARLVFPAYTGLPPKTVEDVRHVTAVEGTEVTLYCQFNKPVTRAVLTAEKAAGIDLVPHDPANHVYTTTLTPTESKRYRVHLTDADGRTNKLPSDVAVNVTKNRPPEVKVTRPGRDSRVSPLEELSLAAEVKDDFGLVRYGLSYIPSGKSTQEVVLFDAAPGVKQAKPEYLLVLEALNAQPDQVVSYYFWAEDVGPDGKRRRTSGDLYFAEVRHFEEIFRQAERQPGEQQEQREQQGQQGGNAQRAEQLAEQQKQIVAGIWKLIRRETGPEPTEKFAEDAGVLHEAQKAVIGQAGQAAERIESSESAAFLDQAVRRMKEAEGHLGGAAAGPTTKPLPEAQAAAQAAYQALLKLRAREFEVSRQNARQQRGQRGQNSNRGPSQQQLRQLDLTNQDDRYETRSAARAQQERQARQQREQQENRELADKLKELARRQADVTDRIKELQAALEQAKDAQAKEELQRQLKRLREQQQEVLRDTDEVQERMEREENRDRMADARQQVEQGRENLRQAADALDRNQLPQAINEGTRAGRQLENVRDQLRRATADRFAEEVRNLRQGARDLDDKQQTLTKQLDGMKDPGKGSLRDVGKRDEVQKGLDDQRKQLDQLTERMKQTVQDAEQPEPLLAQELYNTVRKAGEDRVGEAMTTARQLTAAGGIPDAADAARRAAQGTEQLRKGVEKAAESVLGGQTDALRRAQRELDDLSNQVDREIARATGRQPGQQGQQPGQQDRQGQQPGQRGQQGQQPGQQGQQGQQPGQQGQQPGQQGQQGQQPGQQGQQPGQQGQQPGQQGQQGQQPGQQGQQGQQPGQQGRQPGQQGQQPGRQDQQGQQGQRGRQPGQQGQQGQQPGQQGQGRRSLTDPPTPGERPRTTPQLNSGLGGGGGPVIERAGPIREEGFREWFDRMRAVEDLIDDPALRAEAARIRDRVRNEREEFKRHAKEPDWKKLQEMVATPLNELRNRVAEEVRKRESPNALVPIDRDPVPPEFADGVRRYYEKLGSDR